MPLGFERIKNLKIGLKYGINVQKIIKTVSQINISIQIA